MIHEVWVWYDCPECGRAGIAFLHSDEVMKSQDGIEYHTPIMCSFCGHLIEEIEYHQHRRGIVVKE